MIMTSHFALNNGYNRVASYDISLTCVLLPPGGNRIDQTTLCHLSTDRQQDRGQVRLLLDMVPCNSTAIDSGHQSSSGRGLTAKDVC